MSPARTNFLAKAQASWGAGLPQEVEELAREVDRTSMKAAAKRVGYSTATVSYLLSKTYTGDVDRVQAKIRGALMGETAACPVLGTIGTDRCLEEQAKKFTGASSVRARLYRACRNGCPHSRIKTEDSEC